MAAILAVTGLMFPPIFSRGFVRDVTEFICRLSSPNLFSYNYRVTGRSYIVVLTERIQVMGSSEAAGDLQPDEFPVKSILGQKLRRSHDRFFFLTEWEEINSQGKHVITSEPLENFIRTPAPIFEFVAKGKRSRPDREERRRLARRVCAREYIPSGKEFVKKIYYAFSTKVKGNAQEFYNVRFWGDERLLIVRLIHMEYHFPRELLLFWIKTGSNGPEFCE